MVTVLGVDVNADSLPDDGFKTNEEGDVSRNKFLDVVAVGDTVSVTGNLNNGTAEWKDIELEKE